MSDRAAALRAKLVRNWNTATLDREERAPLYDSLGARLAAGTAASQLGVSVDIVAARHLRRLCEPHRAILGLRRLLPPAVAARPLRR